MGRVEALLGVALGAVLAHAPLLVPPVLTSLAAPAPAVATQAIQVLVLHPASCSAFLSVTANYQGVPSRIDSEAEAFRTFPCACYGGWFPMQFGAACTRCHGNLLPDRCPSLDHLL